MSTNNSTITPTAVEANDVFVVPEEILTFVFTLLLAIALLGMASNVINIIIFYKLRSGDPININLLGLAVSDFAVCLTTFVLTILTAHWIAKDIFMNFKINPLEVFYITIGVPHTVFIRISVLLTAFISLQRCLCVVLPLKVKHILSKGRAKLSVVLSFVAGSLVLIPNYFVNRLEWIFEPSFNMSVLRHVKTDNFYETNYWFTPLEVICLHIIPFLTVTVSTIIMIRTLKKRMAFRQSATRSQTFEGEKKIAIMVIIMSSVFLICNLPNMTMFLTVVFFPSKFSIEKGAESATVYLLGSGALFLDTFNASINILIYYTNSSNYQRIFKNVFGLQKG